jgi:hypothetical protein
MGSFRWVMSWPGSVGEDSRMTTWVSTAPLRPCSRSAFADRKGTWHETLRIWIGYAAQIDAAIKITGAA